MAIEFALILFAGLFLAMSNGANDNFKGVATLFGSKTASYKVALTWGTVTTLAGSLAAFLFAQKILLNFSGKGLVPDSVLQLGAFSTTVAIAAGTTCFLATRFGFPISTTHALTGALVGTGLMASPTGVNTAKLMSTFFVPLMISPFLAIAAAMFLYPLLSFTRRKLGVARESCLCIGNQILMIAPKGVPVGATSATMQIACCPQIEVGTTVTCEERYTGKVLGLTAKTALDAAHFSSAGLVGFARGLNDTPKIAAVLLVGEALRPLTAIGSVALIMALGGWIFSKRVATTMALDITKMNDGQGFSANMVTSSIVLFASHLGLPVSTTHVSCGALFGIGAVTKQGNWKSILKIVMAWVVTLPLASLLGYLCFAILERVL